jgi:hypothetical protein
MHVFLIIAYVVSSTKFEKGHNRFCLEVKWVMVEKKRAGEGGDKYSTQYMHI